MPDSIIPGAEHWPRWVIITDEVWRKTPERIKGGWTELGRVRGWDYADGRVVQVLVLRKRAMD